MFSTKLLDIKKEVIELPNEAPGNPMVSVCVPTYQHAKYIRSCLDSVLMQNCSFPFEVIVGEDESTDGTRDICIEYTQKYPDKIRLFLHSRENNISINGRPTGRFNFLYSLSKAGGKYVALCEGDDYWTDPYKLQKQVNFLEANGDFAICYHNLRVEYEGGDHGGQLPSLANSPYQKEVTGIEDLAFGNYIFTASCMFRNNLFNEFPDWVCNTPVGDYVLHMLNAQFGKIKYLNDVMGVYRVHKGGLWESQSASYRDELWVKMLDQMSNFFGPRIKRSLVLSQNDLFVKLINQFRENRTKREHYSGKILENNSYLFRSSIHGKPGSEVPTVSIVLPLSQDVESTTQCLNSIYENTSPELFGLILVESAPSAGVDDVAFRFERKFDNVIVHRTVEKLTFAEACNRGIKLSDAEFILLLKHNLEVKHGWLEAMLGEAAKDDRIGVVGGRVIYKGTSVIRHAGVKIADRKGTLIPLPVRRLKVDDFVKDDKASRDMQAVSGEFILMKRDLIRTLGVLDENFPETYQGVDLCLRAGRAGYRVRYCADSLAYHIGPEREDIKESRNTYLDRLNHKWAGKVKADLSEADAQVELDEISLRQSILRESEPARREKLIYASDRKESEEFKAFLASSPAFRSGMRHASQYHERFPRQGTRLSENATVVSQFELVSNVRGVIARAEKLIAAKKYKEAEKILKGISLSVTFSVDAINGLAVVKSLEGEHKEALELFKLVLFLDPQNRVANENIRLIS